MLFRSDVVVVRNVGGERVLSLVRWGLVPAWSRDPALASHLLNARAETIADKPSFREAVRRRRCVIPASGFYEWKRAGSRKQPWYFHPPGRAAAEAAPVEEAPAEAPLLAMAGLWEQWTHGGGHPLLTCCIVTTAANRLMAPIHYRMPVLLDPQGVERWLDDATVEPSRLADLLGPPPEEALDAHPVSTAVNNVREDDPRNVQQQEEEAPAQQDLF